MNLAMTNGGPMYQAQAERRSEQRFPLRLPIIVKSFEGGLKEETSQTRDVSARGAFFFLQNRLPEGATIEMTLTLPSEITLTESIKVRCKGKVVRLLDEIEAGKIGTAVVIEQYDFAHEAHDA
ncbi:MAG TPA: PilZ domain-containing protein [Terriglobales bacterium]|nr:PilZ domain-containing protein [Terriglobales bacterium]